MPLAFILDEHLTGPLWSAIQRHNVSGGLFIDAVRVGDPFDLPGGSKDPDILLWCEREGRVLLTFDRNTMPRHLADHLQAGHHSPGVIVLLDKVRLAGLRQRPRIDRPRRLSGRLPGPGQIPSVKFGGRRGSCRRPDR